MTSNHPFLLSTEVDDRDDSAQIGTNEGWDKDTLTLTVSANTPDEIYPYCDFHAGMYTRGKIVKVDKYNVNNLDVTNTSGALQVKAILLFEIQMLVFGKSAKKDLNKFSNLILSFSIFWLVIRLMPSYFKISKL